MIIFLYGPDSYRLHVYAQELQARYRSKYQSGLNLLMRDASTAGAIDDVQESLKNVSFFDEVKFIILKNPFAAKSGSEKIKEILHEQNAASRKDIVILLSEARPGKDLKAISKDLFQLASQKGNTVQEFDYLSGSSLHAWIKKEVERQEGSMDATAIATLSNRIGPETWRLSQEIGKLINYRRRSTIVARDVELLTSSDSEASIFELVDAFATRNQRQSYTLLYQELESGRDPYYILTMLTYQARNILLVHGLLHQNTSTAEVTKRSGLHPFVARKTIEQSKKFTLDEIKDLYRMLGDIEQKTKQGRINLSDHLYLLCGAIAK